MRVKELLTATCALLSCAGAAADSHKDYRGMTVRNFVVDGPKLALIEERVLIRGAYLLQGRVATLYQDQQAAIMARYHPDVGTQPNIPLLTDNASHALRDALYTCDSNPSSGQIGCDLTIRGRATSCELQNSFGATVKTVCIDVDDGELSAPWVAPP